MIGQIHASAVFLTKKRAPNPFEQETSWGSESVSALSGILKLLSLPGTKLNFLGGPNPLPGHYTDRTTSVLSYIVYHYN